MKVVHLKSILLLPVILTAARISSWAAPANTNVDRYGDVVIQSSHGTTDFVHRRFTIKGPNVEVWLSDKSSPVQFHVYCVSVSGSWNTVRQQQQANVLMQGPLRFHVVLKRKGRTQVIDGTSQTAVYSQLAHVVRLLGGVSATLVDNSMLAGPARIHAAEVDFNTIGNRQAVLKGSSYAALVEADLRGNDVRTYHCECVGFSSFSFERPGHITINGTGTHLNLSGVNPTTKLQATMSFSAPSITADFGGEPAQIHAAGGIVADYKWQATAQQPMHAHITAGSLDYLASSNVLTVAGGVHAESGPINGRDVATKLTVTQLTMRTANPEKYVLVADPATSLATFGLGKYGQHALPSANVTATGAVTVTHFRSGVLVPGNSAQLRGPDLNMVYDSNDTGTHATLQCKSIDTTFRADRTLKKLVASHDVHFIWNQNLPPNKKLQPVPTTSVRTVSGTTQTLQVNQTGAIAGTPPQQTVILNGPTDATILLPSLESPVHYTDKAGDRIELNLATQQLDWYTASHSAKFSASVPLSPPAVKGRAKAGTAK